MKFSAVLVLCSLALAATFLGGSDANNITFGYIGRYDFMLFRENVVKSSTWLIVHDKDVVYPAKNQVSLYTISAVKAIDHKRKDGGHAYLYRGGPGYRNATIHLKSERSHGLNYTIEIWGH